MDARLCGEVRAADKRGARGVGGDGSPPKNAGHMWRCAAALSPYFRDRKTYSLDP